VPYVLSQPQVLDPAGFVEQSMDRRHPHSHHSIVAPSQHPASTTPPHGMQSAGHIIGNAQVGSENPIVWTQS